MINLEIGRRFLESRLITMQDVAVELLFSISSFFSGFEKIGLKAVSLLFAWFYFCILTSGFKAHRLQNPRLFIILCGDRFLCGVTYHNLL